MEIIESAAPTSNCCNYIESEIFSKLIGSVLVRLFLSGAAPLDYGNAPLEFSRICSILGLFCA